MGIASRERSARRVKSGPPDEEDEVDRSTTEKSGSYTIEDVKQGNWMVRLLLLNQKDTGVGSPSTSANFSNRMVVAITDAECSSRISRSLLAGSGIMSALVTAGLTAMAKVKLRWFWVEEHCHPIIRRDNLRALPCLVNSIPALDRFCTCSNKA